MQLKEIVKIDNRFQKSVNLQLDLGDMKKVENYIPTRSSLSILKRYLENLQHGNGENATILIGPYGKGKSHLLLVLLALLEGKQKELLDVVNRIKKVDKATGNAIKEIWKEKKCYLPVLVSAGGRDLNQSFLFALQEALKRKHLSELIPDSNYSEAVKIIENWNTEYPEVYEKLEQLLQEKKITVRDLKKRLGNMEEHALRIFEACYPKLTAGSVFAPFVQMDALRAYQEINHQLVEHHGYAGMIIIFDEFSKYMEGHAKEKFAIDMKTLQDMCELANSMENQSMSVILVAHKSIHEYEKGIDKVVKNAFRGVEGRLKEVPFVVTAQNSYELIADSIQKKEPKFLEEFSKLEQEKCIREMIDISYRMPCFGSLFGKKEDYENVVVRGCFPLTPLCAYALLHISEKVAQNERSIFTFLTSREQGSLPRIMGKDKQVWIGIDAIYDYFKPLFKESNDQPQIHNEWLKADYALRKASDAKEKSVIKAISIIQMLRREEELPATDESIRASIGMEETVYRETIQQLCEKQIVIYRSSRGIYAFKNNVGLDIEKEIAKEIKKQSEHFPICEYLNKISELEYVLPKQYNQKQCMTRYFDYEYMMQETFLQMQTTEYLFQEQFSDGKILALVCLDKIQEEEIIEKCRLFDNRIVVVVPDKIFSQVPNLRRLAAIESLQGQPQFIEENIVLQQELELYAEDIIFEINATLEEDFAPGNGTCRAIYEKGTVCRFDSSKDFNRSLSEICERYYGFAPKVNHELLNIQNVVGQYLRARNKVVTAILKEEAEQYATGTAPECMVYRATFIRTGIVGNQFEKDSGCSRILTEIEGFFERCSGERHRFSELYELLQGENYGVRKGILPLFIAQKLTLMEGTPVIYLKNKELEINAETLNRVNDFPQDYDLYVEEEGAKKEQYLRTLEMIWQMKAQVLFKKSIRWAKLVEEMQKWYRSLPQYTMTTKNFESEQLNQVVSFRNLLKRAEINPREALFERIPLIMETEELQEAAEKIKKLKKEMDVALFKMQKEATTVIRRTYGAQESESLKACLVFWYQQQEQEAKNYILSTSAMNFLGYIKNLSTNDEIEIVSQISKKILDIYIEDWKDETLEQFQKELQDIKDKVEGARKNPEEEGAKTIILKDGKGKQIQKNFSVDMERNSTSSYLKNMIDEALEEFEDTLETNQKVAVLVDALERLLQ